MPKVTPHKPIASPLKWHGGKGAFHGKLAEWIVSLMPPHLHYVEPYFGGGSVLLYKNPYGVSEVVNDLNRELTTFWRVLQSARLFSIFQREVQATPFSEAEFNGAVLAANEFGGDEPVACAINFFIRCRQSLAGRMDTFAPLTRNRVRRGMNEQASAWLTAIEGLPAVHARLKRVVVLNARPALKVIQQQDGPQTVFYLDPPYMPATRTSTGEYAHEMGEDDHRELLELLTSLQGKFLLSGYENPLYDSFETCCKWNCHRFQLPNNAASGKHKRVMTECVWTNY